jgi:hypothetical protein
MKRQIKSLSKRLLRGMLETGQRFGVDILPRHFYSEIPAIHELRQESSWRRPLSMEFVRGSALESQIESFQQCFPPSRATAETGFAIHGRACVRNGEAGYGPVEADVLHAFMTKHRPQRIVQIGCGVSTAVMLDAAAAIGDAPNVTCVEPYPTRFLRELAAGGKIALFPHKVQDRIADVQALVRECDFLFVDSTHTLGPAGEVTRIILELLPHLPKEGWAHFHDITFPYDYGRRVLSSELFFAHETSLLLAFLTLNSRFRIAMSLSMLHHASSQTIQAAIPDYRPAANDDGLEAAPGHFPSATYLCVAE